MNFVPYLVSWALLAVTVLALFIWRKAVAIGEDDNLHVTGGASVEKNAAQSAVAQRLELIDRWGKIATVVTVIYGLILGGIYMWMGWVQNRNPGA
jgi:cyanate permease